MEGEGLCARGWMEGLYQWRGVRVKRKERDGDPESERGTRIAEWANGDEEGPV